MITLSLETRDRVTLVDVTALVEQALAGSGLREGAVVVFCPHTTAGMTINENADPTCAATWRWPLSAWCPEDLPFAHLEGNSDAHMKASMMGSSVTVRSRPAAWRSAPGRASTSPSSTAPAGATLWCSR